MVIPRLYLALANPTSPDPDCDLGVHMCLIFHLLHSHVCLTAWALGFTPMPVCLDPWLGVVGQALASKVLLCWPQYPSQLLDAFPLGAAGTHATKKEPHL